MKPAHARLNALVCLAELLSVSAFAIADEKPLLVAASVPIVLLAWLSSRGARLTRPMALPKVVSSLLVLLAVVNATLQASAQTEPFVSLLGQFLAIVTWIKLFDRRLPRDDAQLLTLTIFLAIAGLLTSNSLGMGVVLALYTPVTIAAAMLWQLRDGQYRRDARQAPLRIDHTKSASPQLGQQARQEIARRALGQLTLTTALVTLASIVFASIVFVLTPRGLTLGRSAGFGFARGSTQGFTEQIQLGRAGFLQDNPTPILDLSVSDAENTNIGSGDQTYYLRGTTRSIYREGLWTNPDSLVGTRQTISIDVVDPVEHVIPTQGRAPRSQPTREVMQRISVRPQYTGERYLFSCWHPVALSLDRPGRVTVSPRDGTLLRAGTDGSADGTSGYAYFVRSRMTDDPSDAVFTGTLGFTSGPIPALAWQILSDANVAIPFWAGRLGPREVANVFRDHLRTHFQYTLELSVPEPGQDPLEMFLFETKRGHCEYFASSMVALCQSVGIPARLVAGYVATEYNGITGQYLVRESNAHAWAEVYVGEGRWQTFDPTPPADLERIHRPNPGLLREVRRVWDTLEFAWASAVVSFDQNKQLRLFLQNPKTEPDSGPATRAADGIAKWLQTQRAEQRLMRTFLRLVLAVVLVALALVAVVSFLRSRSKRAGVWRLPRFLKRITLDSAGRSEGDQAYSRALAELERAGLAKPTSRPPIAHADALLAAHPQLASPFRALADMYYRTRFGCRAPDPEENDRSAERLAQLKHAATSLIQQRRTQSKGR